MKASTPSGRWGGFMKASAYSGLVVVDVAIVERDCAILNAEATSILPNKKDSVTSMGRWGGAWWRVWWRLAERTKVAVFE